MKDETTNPVDELARWSDELRRRRERAVEAKHGREVAEKVLDGMKDREYRANDDVAYARERVRVLAAEVAKNA